MSFRFVGNQQIDTFYLLIKLMQCVQCSPVSRMNFFFLFNRFFCAIIAIRVAIKYFALIEFTSNISFHSFSLCLSTDVHHVPCTKDDERNQMKRNKRLVMTTQFRYNDLFAIQLKAKTMLIRSWNKNFINELYRFARYPLFLFFNFFCCYQVQRTKR